MGVNARGIDDACHFAAQGVDFAHQVTLSKATNRWVAWHKGNTITGPDAVLQQPMGSTPVQVGPHPVFCMSPQVIEEQVVESVPFPFFIERNQEQVVFIQVDNHILGILAIGERIA